MSSLKPGHTWGSVWADYKDANGKWRHYEHERQIPISEAKKWSWSSKFLYPLPGAAHGQQERKTGR